MKTNLFKSLLFALIAAMLPQLASAHDFEVDGIYYNINGNEAAVTYAGSNYLDFENEYTGAVNIPSTVTYNGTTYPVTKIGDWAFSICTGLTSVNIPNSVTTIGGYAFFYCPGLTSVAFPNSVTLIGSWAFHHCTSLTSVTIPNSVTEVRHGVFADCSNLTSIIVENGNPKYDSRDNCNAIIETETNNLVAGCINTVIPNSVTSIGDDAFQDCTGLTSVTIPNSVTSIGNYAFDGCSGLTSVNISNSLTSIGDGAFYYCRGLTSVYIPNSVTSIGDSAFEGCYNMKVIICDITSDELKEINMGDRVFEGVNKQNCMLYVLWNEVWIYRQTAPWSDFIIKEMDVFLDGLCFAKVIYSTMSLVACSVSGDVVIPNSITNYEGNYPVTRIENDAFSCCYNVTSVTIPNSVTFIGERAFNLCYGLTSVTIPNSVTSIGYEAFYGCSGLTSVTIPNSVTSIGNKAFYGCRGLNSITVENGNSKYDSRNNCNAIIQTKTNTLITGCKNTIIPNSVTSIGNVAFGGCTGLTSVNIPLWVSSIGELAFAGCNNCDTLIIHNSVNIGADAFPIEPTTIVLIGQGAWYPKNNMPSIDKFKTINIGSGITSLGNFGFKPNLVNSYAETPPTCSSGTFTNYDGALHVPQASTAAYFTADYWQNFTNLSPDLTDKVTLDKTSANIVQWESMALTATVISEDSEIIWSTSNSSIATVSDVGVVTFTGIGECDIFATLASNPAVYAICHITTSYPEITLSLSDESIEINVGNEQTIAATITPGNTGLTPTWSSSNTSVATVDENGKVTAVGEGECDITATVLDQIATCHVTVTNNVTITLNIENAILGANQILTVYPSCTPDVPVEIVVNSSDPSVAVARVVNRTNAPAAGLKSFPEKGMALAMMEEVAAPSESKDPALASTKAIMIVGAQSGTATITVTTADGKAVPAILELRVVDVDGDRTVTATDITWLYNYLLIGDETHIATSDINGDNSITSTDITVLYNLLLGN